MNLNFKFFRANVPFVLLLVKIGIFQRTLEVSLNVIVKRAVFTLWSLRSIGPICMIIVPQW